MMASKKLQPVQRSDAVKFELKILSVADFHRARGNLAYDPTGCYVLYNKSNGKFYVGQAKKLYARVGDHLDGRGCKSLYRDIWKGAKLYIQLIVLKDSGYLSLDVLEHDLICYYDSVNTGYNTLAGNQMDSVLSDGYTCRDLVVNLGFSKQDWDFAVESLILSKRATKIVENDCSIKYLSHSYKKRVPLVPNSCEKSDFRNKGERLGAAEAYLAGREKCGMPEPFCYVSINGSVYHVCYDCGKFGKSKFGYDAAIKYRITIEDAKYLGYSPCSFCSR